MNEGGEPSGEAISTARVIYILYLVSLVVGVTSIIGVVMAYIYRGEAPDWLKTHFTFQIRTFWIGLLLGLVGVILSVVLVGILLLLLLLVWLIIRCVKGMQALDRNEPVADPASWLFG